MEVDTIWLCLEWNEEEYGEVGFARTEEKAFVWQGEGEELILQFPGQKIWSRSVIMLSPVSTKAEDKEREKLLKEFLEEDLV